MKTKRLLFMLLMALMAPWAAMAQSQVCTFGDDATTSSYNFSPYGGYYGWHYQVYLYDATNVNFNGTVSAISFWSSEETSASDVANYTIYMKDVPSNTTLSSSTTFASYLDGADLVLPQTSMPALASGWNQTTLENSFEHESDNSILVMVMAKGCTSNGDCKKSVYYKNTSDHVWYLRKDVSTAPDTNQTGSLTSYLPSVKFTYTEAVVDYPKPKDLTLDAVSGESAAISWTAPNSENTITGYAYQYKKASDSDWSAEESVNTTSATIDELTELTNYNFRVKAVYEGNHESDWATKDFATTCGQKDIPYDYDFETADKFDCWKSISGTVSRTYSTSYSHNSTYYLDFRGTASNMIALPQFQSATNTLRLEFWTRPEDNSSNTNKSGKFAVGYMTNLSDASTFVPIETYNSTAWSNLVYEKKTVDFNVTGVPANAYIALRQFDCSTNYYWFVDDVLVKAIPSCPEPTGLTASLTEGNGRIATLSWTESGEATEWTLEYGTNSDFTGATSVNVTGTPSKDITGLTAEAVYYARVKAVCTAGTDESDWSDVYSFWPTSTVPVMVNNGSTTNGNIPFYGYYTNKTPNGSQFIIPATTLENINIGSTINKIILYGYTTSALSWGSATFNVYMKEVENTTFASANDMVDWASLTNVYNGSLTYSSQQMEILFDNDFIYNGGNLLIGFNINETASSTGSSVSFYGINGTGNCSAYKYMGYNSIQSDVSSFLPKVTFRVIQAEIACDKAKNLAHSAVNHEQATITWTSDESAWQIVWSDDASFDPNGATATNVTEKTYTIPGLSPQTDYYVYVRSDCGSSNYGDWSNIHHFKTTAYAAPVGDYWADNFEGDECGWELINGDLTNKWVHGTAAHNGDGSTKALYISNDGGTSNAFTNSSASAMVYAAKLLSFTNTKYTFAFDWRANGENNCDYLRVVLVPGSATLTAGTSAPTVPSGYFYNNVPTGWIAIDGGSQLDLVTEWQHKEVAVTVPADSYYVVLAWRNDGSQGGQPPAAVDNFSITRVTCPYDVEGLAVANDPAVTESTATVTWTAGEATGWQVAYSTDANFTDGSTSYKTVTEASADLTGLTAATYYYVKVRAYCGGTDYGTWCDAISFHTECLDAEPLPYFNGFEGAAENNMPLCWTRMGTSTTYPMISTGSHYEGTKSLYFYNTSATNNANEIAALPAIDGDINTVRVVFYAKYTSEAPIKVGYVTDLTNAETFVEKAEITLTGNFEKYTVSCKNWGDVTGYIAFKTVYNGTSITGVYLDDVTVELIPDCVDPSGLTVDPTSITTTEADISWTAEGDETQWQAALKRNNGEWENYPTLFDATSGHLANLIPSSIYQVKVRSYCSPSEQSPWSDPVEFKTECVPFTITELSYTQNFEFPEGGTADVNSDILPVCWDHYGTNSNLPHIAQSSGSWSYGYYVHEGTQALSFYGQTVYAIMPEFSNNLSDLQISFWMQMESTSYGTLTLGYITDEDDGTCNTFQQIEACAKNQGEMVQRTMYLNNVPNTASRLVFKWAGSSNYTCCIDDVEVSLAPSCLPVKTLSYNTLKAHQVNLAVTLNDNTQDHFDIQYADDADFTANVVLVENAEFTENAYTLTGLTASHPYYVRIRANCGSGDVSTWSSAVNFTTAIGNPAPSGLTVETNGYGAHSITLKWTNGGGDYETSWEIAYSTDTDFNPDDVTPVAANTNPFTLTGLNHNTKYYGYVRSNCGTDGMSAWSAKQSFSTLNATMPLTLNAATDITNEGATISWTAHANNDHHQSYELYYSIENTAPTETPEAGDNYITGITATSHDLTGLSQLTKYYVWVRDNCGEDGNSPWSTTPASFTTLQTPVVIDADHDFTDNFEGENCNWVLVNGTLTNKWAHGTATNNGGEKAMYVSNDDGTTNAYTNGNTVVYATKLFTLAEGTYTYGYDWKANGETTSGTPYDYLRVALVPSTVTLTAGESLPSGLNYSNMPSGWIALDGGSQLNKQTDWASHNAEITITTAGNYMVVFIWRNDGSSAYQTPAAIDNFHIGVSLCNIPADLAASVTSTSATITWTSTNNNFTLKYKKTSESIWSADIPVTGTSYTLDNVLEPQTAYNVEVVSNCAEGDSDPATLSFTTAYGIPFVETFTTSSIPANWARYSGSVANAFNGTNPTTTTSGWGFSNTKVFGEYHARINIWNTNTYWLTTPNIDLTTATDASKLYLVFDLAITDYDKVTAPGADEPGNDDQFRVLVSTNGGATWTENNSWVWMNEGGDYVYSDIPYTGQTIMLPLSAYASGSVMIAFYAESGSGTSADFDIHIDNVRVGEIGTYERTITGYGESENGGYVLVASPVGTVYTSDLASTHMLENNYDLYYFDQAQDNEWRNYKANNFNLVSGKGYLYANKNDVILTFTGMPYNGNGEVALDYTENVELEGMNLIGNPFATAATLNKPFYKMNNDGDGFTAEIEDLTTTIAAMEGVFVQATGESQTATFTAQTSKGGQQAIAHANIVLSGNKGKLLDNAIIRFGEGNTLEKFSFRANSSKVYIPMDNKDYAVVNAGQTGEIPVNFKAEKNGAYTLSFTNQEVTFSYLHLIDNLTGNDVDLLANPSYNFNAQTTDYASRFKLVFATGSSVEGDSFGFINGAGNLSIFGIEGTATLQVMDVTGRILSSETFSGSYEKKLNVAPGVYVMRLINGDNVRTQKIVVR